jgi:hypothetical protein
MFAEPSVFADHKASSSGDTYQGSRFKAANNEDNFVDSIENIPVTLMVSLDVDK